MKNFPHQFNDINKLINALQIASKLIDNNIQLTDENFGEQLTREGIYTYTDKTLSVDQYLKNEKQKPKSNRGYLTVSRDIRRFLELLDFIVVLDAEKNSRLTVKGRHILKTTSDSATKELLKNALMQLGLEGTDGEISHPYRILLKIINTFPGIETKKLMLALEAENDSEEEFDRISVLINLNIDEIIKETGTSTSMAANAVKILPGLAEQLNDIQRISGNTYPLVRIIITEDEIYAEEKSSVSDKDLSSIKEVNSSNIAIEPSIQDVSSVSIDLSDAIRIRQKRLVEHEEVVRLLALHNEESCFKLFKGKFDCLGIKGKKALLYEVKTILENFSDQEKQTVKGVGQLKYYKFSILKSNMKLSDIEQILVFSRKPDAVIIDFCTAENIIVIWRTKDSFQFLNNKTGKVENFAPDNLL